MNISHFCFLIYISLFCFSFASITEKPDNISLTEYLSLLQQYPHLTQQAMCNERAFEIVLNPDQIQKIMEREYNSLITKGMPPEVAKNWSQAGIVASDPYLFWLRDPIIFPDGTTSLFKRIIWRCTLNQEKPIAILPISDGRIYLIKIWRHATGEWELEIPRGAPNSRETPLETALRELKEETGFIANQIFELGNVNPDSGILSTNVTVFIGFGDVITSTNSDEHEAIDGVYSLIYTLLKKALKKDSCICHKIRGCKEFFFAIHF